MKLFKSLGLIVSLLFATACGVTPVYAQAANTVIGNNTIPGPASPNCTVGPCFIPHVGILSLGYFQFTVATSTALPSVPASAREAFVVCTGQQVNWRDDGVAPTASVGMPLAVSQAFPYTGNLAAIRFIQTTATATCNVTYYP